MPCPTPFVVKNGSKMRVEILRRDSAAGVGNHDFDVPLAGALLGRDGERSFSVHGVNCIENQVHEYLLQLRLIGRDARQLLAVLPYYLDVLE